MSRANTRSRLRAEARQGLAERLRAVLTSGWRPALELAAELGVPPQRLHAAAAELVAASEAAALSLEVVVSRKHGRAPRVFYRSTAAPVLPGWLAPVVKLPTGPVRRVQFGESLESD